MLRIASVIGMAMLCAGALLHQEQVQSARDEGHLDDATNESRAALDAEPSNLQLKHLAAGIFTNRDTQYHKADAMTASRGDFQRAINYYPTCGRACDYLGMIAFAQHDWRNAINNEEAPRGIWESRIWTMHGRRAASCAKSGGPGLHQALPAGCQP